MSTSQSGFTPLKLYCIFLQFRLFAPFFPHTPVIITPPYSRHTECSNDPHLCTIPSQFDCRHIRAVNTKPQHKRTNTHTHTNTYARCSRPHCGQIRTHLLAKRRQSSCPTQPPETRHRPLSPYPTTTTKKNCVSDTLVGPITWNNIIGHGLRAAEAGAGVVTRLRCRARCTTGWRAQTLLTTRAFRHDASAALATSSNGGDGGGSSGNVRVYFAHFVYAFHSISSSSSSMNKYRQVPHNASELPGVVCQIGAHSGTAPFRLCTLNEDVSHSALHLSICSVPYDGRAGRTALLHNWLAGRCHLMLGKYTRYANKHSSICIVSSA